MKYIVVSVRDIKQEVYNRPHFTRSIGEAARSFEDEVNRADDNNLAYKYPQDVQLFQLGTYDDDLGIFETHIPKIICEGVQVAKHIKEETKISKV